MVQSTKECKSDVVLYSSKGAWGQALDQQLKKACPACRKKHLICVAGLKHDTIMKHCQ